MTASPDHVLGLTLDGTPPSWNAIPDMGAPFRAEVATWRERIGELLRGSGPAPTPALARVEASVALAFPDRRRRASSNYAPVLARALGEALVGDGWLSASGCFTLAAPTFEEGGPTTTVELRGWGATR